MKRLNKMIVCLGGVLVFSMGLNFSVQTIYAQENEYSYAAEPPVQFRLSHLSRRSEPL